MQRVIVLSGGGTGIGRATAEMLAADGDHVLILGRRPEPLEETARAVNAAVSGDGEVSWLPADLSAPAEAERVAEHVRGTFGTVDAIVNNAGGRGAQTSESLEGLAEHWRSAFEQNVLTAVLLTTALASLLRRPGGRIVLLSSMATRTGGGTPPYAAAKSALNGWVHTLTTQYAPEGITANVVMPGYTPETELFSAGMPEDAHERIVSRTAMGRAARTEEIAAAIRFLVSPEASFVTSQILEVHGGTVPPNR